MYAFDLYDHDKSGFIEATEMKTIVISMMNMLGTFYIFYFEKILINKIFTFSGQQQTEDSINEIADQSIKTLDKDGDGKISKNEFIDGLLQNNRLRKILSPFE